MGDQQIVVDLIAKTKQFENGFKRIDTTTAETIKGVVYFFTEASRKALTFEDSLGRVTRGMLKLSTIGQEVCNVLNNSLGQLAKDAVAPLKINIDESATAFQGFMANIANGLIDLIGKVVIQGGIFAALISGLNLIPPPGVIGTAFAKFLAGGADLGGMGSFGGFLKELTGLTGLSSKQAGGEIEETGLHQLHKGEWVIPTRLAEVLGSLVNLPPQGITAHSLTERFNAFGSQLTQGIRGALQPAFAGGGMGERTIVVRFPDPIGALAEVYETSSIAPGSKVRLGRICRKAIGLDQLAD